MKPKYTKAIAGIILVGSMAGPAMARPHRADKDQPTDVAAGRRRPGRRRDRRGVRHRLDHRHRRRAVRDQPRGDD